MTPAQASGHPDFVTDWPIQGPTDPGIRAADCWWKNNVLPTPEQASCVDCKGPIPMWAQSKGVLGGDGWGGIAAPGMLAAAGDPDAWVQLDKTQQTWVATTLSKLNDLIVKSGGGRTCPTWAPAIPAATGCFQQWFNGSKLGLTNRAGQPVVLRTDGVFDQDTLDALRTVVSMNPKDFPTPFPGTSLPERPGAKKLSTGAIVGMAAGGAAVLGGVVYVATRKKSRRSRRR